LALVHGRARAGVHAPAVTVEVHLGGGLPSMSIVGLPEAAVREAKDRVRAAIQCAQFEFPARRITVNLAPADLPKGGGRFDLPIALGILAASGQIPREPLAGCEFLGELGLAGELRPVDGVLPAALAAARAGRRLVVAEANGPEAALAAGLDACTARTLLEVCALLDGRKQLPPPVATTCCCPVRRAAARPCSPPACPACCPKPAKPRRWRPPRWPRSAGAGWIRPAGANARSALRTTPPARSPWPAGAATRVRARSRSPTTACCSWTSCPNGAARPWRCCANRSNRVWSRSRAP